MSRQNGVILGLFGLIYEHLALRDLSKFVGYLQRVSSDDTSLLLSTAEYLVKSFKGSKNVVWAMNSPEYELDILRTAIEMPKLDKDPSGINLQKKIYAFTYIKDFIDIHKSTFPYIEVYFEPFENPGPHSKDVSFMSNQNNTIDESGKISKSLPAILLPSAIIGATVMYAVHKTRN